jgi:Rps23 Pro-64 3,4-dihydroxylase Tpa1-like proline 4-hydroxylase
MSSDTSSNFAALNIKDLRERLSVLKTEFATAHPYQHVVIDNFLPTVVFQQAMADFDVVNKEQWTGYLHVNERKFANSSPSTWGPTLQRIASELNSPEFVSLLEELTGIPKLLIDPTFEGGGLHQSLRGGFLNMHADFTVHPHQRQWKRRLNLLLYCNENWLPEYGGGLELWDATMSHAEKVVQPLGNRVLIFATDATSFHGHPDPLQCPDGVARRSMALYYFTFEDKPNVRSTEYRARPSDGSKGILIYLDKMTLRIFDKAKRRLGISNSFANRVLRLIDRVRHFRRG